MSMEKESDGLEVLGPQECRALLRTQSVGRVGFVAEGRLHVLPVNYGVDRQGAVVFRTTGNSVLMAVATQHVVFEVDGLDHEHHTGWSVCVRGTGREVTDREDATGFGIRATNVVPWAPGRRGRWFAISPLEITGRRLVDPASAEGRHDW